MLTTATKEIFRKCIHSHKQIFWKQQEKFPESDHTHQKKTSKYTCNRIKKSSENVQGIKEFPAKCLHPQPQRKFQKMPTPSSKQFFRRFTHPNQKLISGFSYNQIKRNLNFQKMPTYHPPSKKSFRKCLQPHQRKYVRKYPHLHTEIFWRLLLPYKKNIPENIKRNVQKMLATAQKEFCRNLPTLPSEKI